MTYRKRTYTGLFQGSPVNRFQAMPGVSIDINTVKTIGSIYLLKPFLKALGIGEIVDRIAPMERDVGGLTHGQVIEQLVLNRLNDPCPLMHLEEWAEARGIMELYGIPPSKLNDDRVGRALDEAATSDADIEDALTFAVLSRFPKIDTDNMLWDCTSFYFEGVHDDSELVRLGYSRDQKQDKKQAVVELNVTAREGIPLAHRLLPGNASDHKEALNNLERLKRLLKKKDFLIIGDRAVVIKSDELYEQQRKTLDKNIEKFEAKLQKIKDALNVRKFKNIDYVADRVKKALQGQVFLKQLFRIILEGENGALILRWEQDPLILKQEDRLLGKYVLATSLDAKTDDMDAVLSAYKSRHRVEDRFRSIKSTLKIRPVFLQNDDRIRSLVLVTIIALIVYALIEWVCQQERLASSARQALFMFRMPAIISLSVNGQLVQQIGNIQPFMHEILDALNVRPLELDDMNTG